MFCQTETCYFYQQPLSAVLGMQTGETLAEVEGTPVIGLVSYGEKLEEREKKWGWLDTPYLDRIFPGGLVQAIDQDTASQPEMIAWVQWPELGVLDTHAV